MNAKRYAGNGSRFRRGICTIAAAIGLVASAPAGASLIITVGNVAAGSPSSNNSLEVDLLNTGPTAISLGAFSFEITVADPHIIFMSATINTLASYVFAGNSLLGPAISTSAPGQTLDALDLWSGVGGASIAAGATVGLGHVFFDVSAGGLPGPVTVTLSTTTSLTDDTGVGIPIGGLIGGSITITGRAVPEPPPAALVLLGLLMLAAGRSSRAIAPRSRP